MATLTKEEKKQIAEQKRQQQQAAKAIKPVTRWVIGIVPKNKITPNGRTAEPKFYQFSELVNEKGEILTQNKSTFQVKGAMFDSEAWAKICKEIFELSNGWTKITPPKAAKNYEYYSKTF